MTHQRPHFKISSQILAMLLLQQPSWAEGLCLASTAAPRAALGSKGYDQPVVGCQGLSSPLCVSPGNCSVHWAATGMQGCNEHDAGFGVRFSVWCYPVWWCDQLSLLFRIRKVEMTRTCGQIAITEDASNCLNEINNRISFMYKW